MEERTLSSRIRDLPDEDRPREKLAKRGPAALTDSELLAIFLRVGIRGMNAVDLARSLLERHGSLAQLSRCTVMELAATKGVGLAKGAQLAAAFELGNRLAGERVKTLVMDEPQKVYDLLGAEMRALRQESLRVVLLDTRGNLIRVVEVTRGTKNESLAHPGEILRVVLIEAAHSFILVHNHPSGDPNPSAADRSLTQRLTRASQELGINFSDHIIIGAPNERGEPYFSFREYNLL